MPGRFFFGRRSRDRPEGQGSWRASDGVVAGSAPSRASAITARRRRHCQPTAPSRSGLDRHDMRSRTIRTNSAPVERPRHHPSRAGGHRGGSSHSTIVGDHRSLSSDLAAVQTPTSSHLRDRVMNRSHDDRRTWRRTEGVGPLSVREPHRNFATSPRNSARTNGPCRRRRPNGGGRRGTSLIAAGHREAGQPMPGPDPARAAPIAIADARADRSRRAVFTDVARHLRRVLLTHLEELEPAPGDLDRTRQNPRDEYQNRRCDPGSRAPWTIPLPATPPIPMVPIMTSLRHAVSRNSDRSLRAILIDLQRRKCWSEASASMTARELENLRECWSVRGRYWQVFPGLLNGRVPWRSRPIWLMLGGRGCGQDPRRRGMGARHRAR